MSTEEKTELNMEEAVKVKVQAKDVFRTLTIWPLIGRKLGAEVLYDRLKDYYSMIASVSGLISGFVFIVTNTPVEWKYRGMIARDTRSDIFGGLLLLGLIVALVSTLFATALYGLVNMIGPDDELLTEFISQNEWYLGKPNLLMMWAVVIMLIGSGFAVGGLYSDWVFWMYVTVTVLMAGGLLFYFIKNGRATQIKCRSKLNSMPDFTSKKEE
mmetsp:Transcript_44015/g.70570  ORF Transcript_44015/g.70570 Transcript_44015/m.70570 type:complete len:213 (+) Transcript_44015:36-674(+)|eukprot:CAMPEP_0197030572 /NCGR_PEP_ID=MMETSP1384-20130603/9784_1 /TAXON_ID=29189 /ORGANISM="Ammonia sp." /LENGTH=212 /DNA_ID=CAMNT_0042459953 /DNA_START=35 /DNA_END=673 /DNA_ORIENTATION=-